MKYYLGIDAGSVTLKLVVWNEKEIVWSCYRRISGALMSSLKTALEDLKKEIGNAQFAGVAVVGSGRHLVGSKFDIPMSDEISAQVEAARNLFPDVKSIIEIGGQDAKAISMKEDGSVDFLMNDLCAAGTGAFLDQQAARLGLKVEELSDLASKSFTPLSIASRCSVFAKSDMTHHQQAGRALSDIVAGLHVALAKGFLAHVSRGLNLEGPVSFHGGVAANKDLVARFEDLLGEKVHVPEYHRVTGALGAAIIASRDSVPKKLEDLMGEVEECSDPDDEKLSKLDGSWFEVEPKWPEFPGIFFGVDVGSVSVKMVALNKDGPIYQDYRYSNGDPKTTLTNILNDACKKLGCEPLGVGVTGSGRSFASWIVGGDSVPNEITAQNRACEIICPDAEVIVEIGGQDAKYIERESGRLVEFKMNRGCSAGTGAFLTEQCPRLGFDSEEDFCASALDASSSPKLGARCTVFMESDLVSHQQRGWNRSELAAGLARSVVHNYLEKVAAPDIADKKILFLGGVAENRAVAKALSEEIGSSVVVTKWGKYTGSIGAAVIAADDYKAGKYNDSKFSWEGTEDVLSDRCEDCGHACLVWKLPDGKIFGGRCGKYEQEVVRKEPELFGKRRRLLEGDFSKIEPGRVTVGVPRSIMFFDRFPMWREFFDNLGVNIVVSPDDHAVEMPPMPADTCLPIKLLVSDCKALDNMGCDFLFVPAMVCEDDKVLHCPLIQCAPLFAKFGIKTPLVECNINWEADPKSEKKVFTEVGTKLGFNKLRSKQVYQKAVSHQNDFTQKVFALGEDFLSDYDGRAFVVLGKDYNIFDPRLNSGVASILGAHLPVLSQDMITESPPKHDPEYPDLHWHHGLEMLAAARKIAEDKRLLPVLVTSFGCGPDSFTIRYVREALGDKPLLLLEVDEHTSDVGIATRVEAYLDSLKGKDSISRIPHKPTVRKEWKRVFIPNFSLHTLGMAAAVKFANLEPVLLPPCDEDSYQLAKKYIDGGECHPFALMLGDLLKASQNAKEGDCFFLSPGSTACRLGHFGKHMRMIARDNNIPMDVTDDWQRLAELGGVSLSKMYKEMLYRAWPVMRGADLIYQKYFEVKRRAESKSEVDRVFQNVSQRIIRAVMEEEDIYEAYSQASEMLDSIPLDLSKNGALKVGITGDYFTRICDFANSNVLHEITDRGFDVLMSPTFTEVSVFDAHCFMPAGFKHRDLKKFGVGAFIRNAIPKMNRRLEEIVTCNYSVPLDYNKVKDEIKKYIPVPMHNSVVGTLAAVLEQVDAGAKGLINIITFNCTYGAVAAAFLRKLSKDTGIPSINLIYEGLKPTHNLTRLEAFLNQLR